MPCREDFAYSMTVTEEAQHTSNDSVTSLPKAIWEKGRVAALSDTYAVNSPLVTMVRPKFAHKSTHSRGPIAKPHYLSHPWTRLTYDAKRHPDPIRRFSTMHWTDKQTDRPTARSRESLMIIGRCAPTATRPNNGTKWSPSNPTNERQLLAHARYDD